MSETKLISTPCSASSFIDWLNSHDSREHHRRDFNDLEWARQQPKGSPKYKIGDVIRFHVGGYGVIRKVSEPHGGWPSSYATEALGGFDGHATGKCAWHYEGDFAEWIAKSPLHSLQNAEVSHDAKRRCDH